jgi:hypothetical protein
VAQWHKWQLCFANATNTANTPHEPMAMFADFEAQCFEEEVSPPDNSGTVSKWALMCLVKDTERLGFA